MDRSEELQAIVASVHAHHVGNRSGAVADYIPGLASVDPEPFGVAIVTVKGQEYVAGDVDAPFTLQSVSKPLVFAAALDIHGPSVVFDHVDVEPSGDAFNSIELHPESRRPFNPMVNAGAIAMSGLLYDAWGSEAEEKLLELLSRLAGTRLSIDEAIFESEWRTAHRNRALAHLLCGAGVLKEPVEPRLKLYTRQCALTVTARQLAVMGASMANVGDNPVTRDPVFDPIAVRHALSVMFSCGMYDYAGRWGVDIGLPAKSGVSGGLLAVVNRQAGIGIFSPRLDSHGNSVRATAACAELAEELGLHAFDSTNTGSRIFGLYL